MRSNILVKGGGLFFLISAMFFATPVLGKTNIIFIMTDDVGYGDLGSYGATVVRTPNLDILASQGMRFTNAHSEASVCSPSRFSMLTGVYAWRPPALSNGILSPTAALTIPTTQLTVASLLKGAGYTTAVVGKWHLGLGSGTLDFNAAITPGPREIGFDYSFIIPSTGDRIPCVYLENRNVYKYNASEPITIGNPGTPTGTSNPGMLLYPADVQHSGTICNGISRIGLFNGGQSARWNDEFMIDTLTDKAIRFIENNQSNPFFLYFSTHDVHVPRWPDPRFRGQSQCGIRCDALMEMDWSVGQIMATLTRLNLNDSTLLIFSSDNGPVIEDGYTDGSQANLNGHTPSGPLTGGKYDMTEGGARVPFIARWPGRIPAGSVNAQLIAQQDMMATFAAMNNLTLPGGVCWDTKNILPTLQNINVVSRTSLIVQNNQAANLAILSGDYKLIRNAGALYNLRMNLAETNNIAAANAALVTRLRDSITVAQNCVPTPIRNFGGNPVMNTTRFCSAIFGKRALRIDPHFAPPGTKFTIFRSADGKKVYQSALWSSDIVLPSSGIFVVTAHTGLGTLLNSIVVD